MASKTLHCNEDHHNKVWSYTTKPGSKVTITYGRVGGHMTEETKNFTSEWEMEAFLSKKVAEKIKKGYKETTQQQLKEETKTAQALGAMYKLSRVEWAEKQGNTLKFTKDYDTNKSVYVEIMNSWTKEVTHYLIGKAGSEILNNVEPQGTKMKYGSSYVTSNNHVDAIKDYLKRLQIKVKEVVTQKFAVVGVRNIDWGDGETVSTASAMKELVASVSDSSASAQVVVKFAALGARFLDI